MSEAEREAWKKAAESVMLVAKAMREAWAPLIRAAGSAVPTHPEREESE